MLSRLSLLGRHVSPLRTAGFTSSLSYAYQLREPGSLLPLMASAAERTTRTIHTAACLIIGDEILGGKTVDTNSTFFAKYCFSLGIDLKRVEVIPDDETDIAETARRLSDRYDFVVTAGGIGPTHDDITYQSIAKAFDVPLVLHQAAFERMKRLSRPQANFTWDKPSAALDAKMRMVRLPIDEKRDLDSQALFVSEQLWVPISVVNGNVHILPGIPRLFEGLLDGLRPRLLPRLTDPEGKGMHRVIVSTPMPESAVASFLTELAAKVESKGVKVGSYPHFDQDNNSVTLVGRDKTYIESLVPEVEKAVQGKRVPPEAKQKPAL